MKLRIPGLALLALALGAPGGLAAQQQAPSSFVVGTYFRCDVSREDRATDILRTVYAPLVQKRMTPGPISAWGILAHHDGGPWRRALYFVGTNLDGLLAARDSIVAEARTGHAKEATEFGSICASHDDYIWAYVVGSQPAAAVGSARPTAGFSTYQVCHEATEGLSDEVMKSLYAPIYDAQVKAGRLHSWAWFSHFVGGKYRRLLVLDGPSFASILAARDSVIAETQAKYPQIGAADATVCDGHTDYLWDIVLARP